MSPKRIERMDRHIETMREFMLAELKDGIAEDQQRLDEAVARGDERDRELYEYYLARSRARLQRWEAEQPAV